MINISVIVPCYNEQETISKLLEAIYFQTYPTEEVEVIIADGLSTDQTRSVVNAFKSSHPNMVIRIVDNLERIIPSGLNRALKSANGKYIIRMDAHSVPDRTYIEKCINGLKQDLGDNIGGLWKIEPGSSTWISRAIAGAASHPLGAGDAHYRIGGIAQEVDTVPFGAFEKNLTEKIGMFDESLLSNEDYEFNARIRKAGGKVWLDPSIRSTYYARSTLKELSRQYWRYGYWKAQMLKKHPSTLKWRQILPPLFVLSFLILGLLSPFWDLARWLLAIDVLVYAIIIFGVGIQLGLKAKDMARVIGVPLALSTIHFSWGAAFIWGVFTNPTLDRYKG